MEWHPSLHLGVVAIEKGTFGSPSTKAMDITWMSSAILKGFLKNHINQKKNSENTYRTGLVWFLCPMAYQLFLGYLMSKPFS